MAESAELFLGEDATVEERWRAIYQALQAWHQSTAQVGAYTHIEHLGDLSWTSNRLCIPSEDSLDDGHVIDEILTWFRSQRPLQGVLWWYLRPEPPLKLEARLFARGVSPNWRPHWMWCDLHEFRMRPSTDSNFMIKVATTEDYLVSDNENDTIVEALSKIVPRRVFHLVAAKGIVQIGRCILSVTTGELGIGALFDMMVAPKERKQGVGTALVQAACEMAREMGCNYVTLNATELGEPVYRRVGFRSMGLGYTWYLKARTLEEGAPATEHVKFLEAVGLGDVEVLEGLRQSLTRDQLQNETLNELTPFEIAVRCQQPESASWLLAQGVVPDIMSLWDLGWKDRVPALITQHPDLVNRESGKFTATPLHIAIERDDMDLAKLLLTVPNDLDAKDAVFRSTPVGWAHHFQRNGMLALLEEHTEVNIYANDRAILENILGKERIRADLVAMTTEV